jgi:hypothetical protein
MQTEMSGKHNPTHSKQKRRRQRRKPSSQAPFAPHLGDGVEVALAVLPDPPGQHVVPVGPKERQLLNPVAHLHPGLPAQLQLASRSQGAVPRAAVLVVHVEVAQEGGGAAKEGGLAQVLGGAAILHRGEEKGQQHIPLIPTISAGASLAEV